MWKSSPPLLVDGLKGKVPVSLLENLATSSKRFIISSHEEMISLGKLLSLSLPRIVIFEGDLGSGKTTLIKGIISEKAKVAEEAIISPTFNIVHTFGSIAHFDLYRLEKEEEFYARGLEEYLETSSLCLIEWAEKALGAIPKNRLKICIEILPSFEREVTLCE